MRQKGRKSVSLNKLERCSLMVEQSKEQNIIDPCTGAESARTIINHDDRSLASSSKVWWPDGNTA
jgi:hypothetical protein